MSKNYHIQEDFQKVFSNFTQAILFYKPKDIIDFAINYFTSLEKKVPLEQILSNKKNSHISKTESTLNNEQNIEEEENINLDETSSYNNFEANDKDESNIKIPLTKELKEIIIEKDIENKNKFVKNNIKEEISENNKEMTEIKEFVSELFKL